MSLKYNFLKVFVGFFFGMILLYLISFSTINSMEEFFRILYTNIIQMIFFTFLYYFIDKIKEYITKRKSIKIYERFEIKDFFKLGYIK